MSGRETHENLAVGRALVDRWRMVRGPGRIERRYEHGPVALTAAQRGVWLFEQANPGTAVYNLSFLVRLVGRLDAKELGSAFDRVVRRHETLRTTVGSSIEGPWQVVRPDLFPALRLEDLRERPEAQRYAEATRLAAAAEAQPFDITDGPLVRATVYRIDDDVHLLSFVAHHLVCDGPSLDVVFAEIAAECQRATPRPAASLPIQFSDFAIWQETQDEQVDAERIRSLTNRLADVPAIEFPHDHVPPSDRNFAAGSVEIAISADTVAALRSLGQGEDATLFMVLLAGWCGMLSRFSEHFDFGVGVSVARRNSPELSALIGMIVNLVVVRPDVSGDPDFSELVGRVRTACLAAFKDEDISFEILAKEIMPLRDISLSPLFESMFILHSADPAEFGLPGVTVEPVLTDRAAIQVGLEVHLWSRGGGLWGRVDYSRELYDTATAELLADGFARLLRLAADSGATRLSEPALPRARPGHTASDAGPEPAGRRPTGTEPAAPRTAVEQQTISLVWAELLGRQTVGVDENFFELGGHSLLAMRAIARLEQIFNVRIPLKLLHENPTVSGLAARLPERSGDSAAPIPVCIRTPNDDGRTYFRASYGQQRLWLTSELGGEAGRAYLIQAAVRLEGELRRNILQESLNILVERHAILRTGFQNIDGKLWQVVSPEAEISVEFVDDDLSVRSLAERAGRAFNLEQGPLLRVSAAHSGPHRHLLVLTMHHIISDGWSMSVLGQELAMVYSALAEGRLPKLAELAVQYADFAEWQQARLESPELSNSLDYWRNQLDGCVLVGLPADHPRPAAPTHRTATVRGAVPPEVAGRLGAIAVEQRATPFMVLLAAFMILLQRYCGEDDIAVGTPTAGRNRPEIESLVGFFVNTLVIRSRPGEAGTFAELLHAVRDTVLDAFARQEVPLEMALDEVRHDRSPGRLPLIPVMFNYLTYPAADMRLPGITAEMVEPPRRYGAFDIDFYVQDNRDGGMELTVQYNTDLYGAATVESVVAHYTHLLLDISNSPRKSVDELHMIGSGESPQLLRPVSPSGESRVTTGESIWDCFAAQVAQRPAKAAILAESGAVTYATLAARARALSHHLALHVDGPGRRIGILCAHGAAAVTAMLGILGAGSSYVPLDPAQPEDRLAEVIRMSDLAAIVVDERHRQVAAAVSPQGLSIVPVNTPMAEHEPQHGPAPFPSFGSVAYLLHTSRAKAVVQSQENVLRHVRTYAQILGITAADRLSSLSSITSDAAVLDIFAALLSGATLCPIDLHSHDLASAAERVRTAGVTVYHSTPTVFRHLLHLTPNRSQDVRAVVLSGEEVHAADVTTFREHFAADARLVNLYGSAECTVALMHRLDDRPTSYQGAVPIGRPVHGVDVELVDRRGRPAEVFGELVLKGRALAVRQDESAQVLRSGSDDARRHRTGDLCRITALGELVFVGHRDTRVRLRGSLAEPGEIEARLQEVPRVAAAAVVRRTDPAGQARLVAYVVADGVIDPEQLRERLRHILPSSMIPALFVQVPELPLTSAHKVDPRWLPEPPWQRPGGSERPLPGLEATIAAVWEEILEVRPIGRHDDFFELGGQSLLATLAAAELSHVTGFDVPIYLLFERTTVTGLAAKLTASGQETGDSNSIKPRPRVSFKSAVRNGDENEQD